MPNEYDEGHEVAKRNAEDEFPARTHILFNSDEV